MVGLEGHRPGERTRDIRHFAEMILHRGPCRYCGRELIKKGDAIRDDVGYHNASNIGVGYGVYCRGSRPRSRSAKHASLGATTPIQAYENQQTSQRHSSDANRSPVHPLKPSFDMCPSKTQPPHGLAHAESMIHTEKRRGNPPIGPAVEYHRSQQKVLMRTRNCSRHEGSSD